MFSLLTQQLSAIWIILASVLPLSGSRGRSGIVDSVLLPGALR